MSIGRSRRLVGRDGELTVLRAWLAQAGDGRGGVYVIAGEPGVGKSRLAGEAIAALPESWFVSRGRATDRDRPAPFRPIAEAMLAASRRRPLPEDPDVRAFAAVLGPLVPAWRQGGSVGEPVVVVAEAVLRVLHALAAPSPAVVLIEDVQLLSSTPAAWTGSCRSPTPMPGGSPATLPSASRAG